MKRTLHERHIHRWHNLRRWWRNLRIGYWTNPVPWFLYDGP